MGILSVITRCSLFPFLATITNAIMYKKLVFYSCSTVLFFLGYRSITSIAFVQTKVWQENSVWIIFMWYMTFQFIHFLLCHVSQVGNRMTLLSQTIGIRKYGFSGSLFFRKFYLCKQPIIYINCKISQFQTSYQIIKFSIKLNYICFAAKKFEV